MDWIKALILGIVQGLTEYLPVSSSGHLAIGSALLHADPELNLTFDVMVHVATVLSTCVILWKEIVWILKDLVKFKWNDGTKFFVNILVSMIPIMIVGFCFKDYVDDFFDVRNAQEQFGNPLLIVGCCLMLTALLLAFSYFAKPRRRDNISPLHAFIIGIAQAVAVLPGLSRSGSTIATGLLLGNKKESLAQFSFLMVIPPILGEALLDARKLIHPAAETVATTASAAAPEAAIGYVPLAVGFVAAFVVGCLACKWMINIVRRGKLIWFAVYCAIISLACIILPYVFPTFFYISQ
ncbi:MAG: undecaprenyl-diphosphate phosphatase [Bacteroidales bacterium]|nr:undecaprenyl-diphosphate phosphatase [Bacteroidales bacterium]